MGRIKELLLKCSVCEIPLLLERKSSAFNEVLCPSCEKLWSKDFTEWIIDTEIKYLNRINKMIDEDEQDDQKDGTNK